MRILVTGGSGFIGRHVCKQMLKRGHDVIDMDIVDPEMEDIEYVNLSISDSVEKLAEVLRGADAVIHLAALSRERDSGTQSISYFQTNVEGTFKVLQACVEASVPKFVFASSYLVYGETNGVGVLGTPLFDLKASMLQQRLQAKFFARISLQDMAFDL